MNAYATTKDLRSTALYNADGTANVMHGMNSEQCDALECRERFDASQERIVKIASRIIDGPPKPAPRNFAEQWREGYERMTRGAG